MAVSVDRGVMPLDPASVVPRSKWGLLVKARRMSRMEINQNCRAIEFYERDGRENGWLGHSDRESYWRDGIGLDPQIVDWALAGLECLDPAHEAGLDAMAKAGKELKAARAAVVEAQVAVAKEAPATLPPRRPTTDEVKERSEKGVHSTPLPKGNSAARTVARLKTHQPDLAEKVMAGELTAYAAGRQAGIIKAPLALPDDIERIALALKRKFTATELQQLVNILTGEHIP
jgi:hypothetical protein